jgi:hypothetical protein
MSVLMLPIVAYGYLENMNQDLNRTLTSQYATERNVPAMI